PTRSRVIGWRDGTRGSQGYSSTHALACVLSSPPWVDRHLLRRRKTGLPWPSCGSMTHMIPPRALVVAPVLAVGLVAQQWQRTHPLPGAVVAVDVTRNATIMFDGATWRFDGADWRRVPTAHGPSQLASGLIVYDWARQRTVQVGGSTFTPGAPADPWEVDRLGRTLQTPPAAPPARFTHPITL